MTNNQIILNILILSAFIAYIGWTKLMPHFLAYKASNDERVISGILSLKNSFRCELGNSIIIRQGLNSYIPTLKMDVQSVVNIKDLLNSLGYKKPFSIALLLYYFAQQDLARFRYIVVDGHKFKNFAKLSYKTNVSWIFLATSLTIIFVIAFVCIVFKNAGVM